VLAKAQRGLGLSGGDLAARAGIGEAEVAAALNGEATAPVLSALAGALGLHSGALIAMADRSWMPGLIKVDGLELFNTTWSDMTVNAFVVWDAATNLACVFDTGADAGPILQFIKAKELRVDTIFITHTHPDHVQDLAKLVSATRATVLINEREPYPGAETFSITPDLHWCIGGLRITPRHTYGHASGGTSYVIDGLARQLVVVGDALFASSMGGPRTSYADALRTTGEAILTLGNETVVCPGHGPLTTVGEERAHNPFFPEFKA
jgi:hydroxyacylglutathione hydrolase